MLAGAVADRVDRRKLLVWAFITLAACAFVMGFTISNSWTELWHILLFSFVMGSIATFTMTAHQAFVVDIVSRDDAMGAISMNSVAMRIMGVFGGVVSGAMILIFSLLYRSSWGEENLARFSNITKAPIVLCVRKRRNVECGKRNDNTSLGVCQ